MFIRQPQESCAEAALAKSKVRRGERVGVLGSELVGVLGLVFAGVLGSQLVSVLGLVLRRTAFFAPA